jgi:hypothetical protein
MVSLRHDTSWAENLKYLSRLGSGSERSGGSSPLPRTDREVLVSEVRYGWCPEYVVAIDIDGGVTYLGATTS